MFTRLIQVCLAAVALLAGLTAGARAEAPSPEQAMAREVRAVLDELAQVYAAADPERLRRRLDAAFIGHDLLLLALAQELQARRQVRLYFLEPQVNAGPDVAAVQVRWEKRFFHAADYRPDLAVGTALLLLHREPDGWKVAAIAGDNPLLGTMPVPATERRRRAPG